MIVASTFFSKPSTGKTAEQTVSCQSNELNMCDTCLRHTLVDLRSLSPPFNSIYSY